mmetsp:Transcript_114009/g.243140  ORF Transcript_114009/g.243140 Transcript_114009/m.243140 type:complete len:217 (+) Transcript_114009:844-1494(+)
MCVPANTWFTNFMLEPNPGFAPSTKTLPMPSRTLRHFSTAAASADTIKVSSPFPARTVPPDMGASTKVAPCATVLAAISSAKAGLTVAQTTHAPLKDDSPPKTAPGPSKSTDETCCALSTATTSTSTPSAQARGVSARTAPNFSRSAQASGRTSKTRNDIPFRTKELAIPLPMAPKPTKPTLMCDTAGGDAASTLGGRSPIADAGLATLALPAKAS